MLREVLDQNPDNREAIINLGLLSIRSGQFGRGVERFKDALRIDSTDHEAMLFLGVCYQELQQADSATYWFEKITVAEDADPAIQAAAVEYLEEN
jgi:Flp pilus assembly protein TadD